MSKRRPGAQLTQDNWDVEDEKEEGGIFKEASEDVLKKRQIIVAKRRTNANTSETGETTKAFKGFSGFGMKTPSAGGGSVFSGLGGDNKKIFSSNGDSSSSFAPKSTSAFTTSTFPGFSATATSSSSLGNDENDKKQEKSKYLQKLRALNECVSTWIKQHVDKNPYCILTPIFNDYEKHLREVELSNPECGTTKNGKTESPDNSEKKATPTTTGFQFTSSLNKTTTSTVFPSNGAPKTIPETKSAEPKNTDLSSKPFSFSTTSAADPSAGKFAFKTTSNSFSSSNETTTTSKFSFGASSTTSNSTAFNFGTASGTDSTSATNAAVKPFSFASTSLTGAASDDNKPKFSFGGTAASSDSTAKPFSFASNPSSQTSSAATADGEEEYVPPEPETVEIKEDGAIYTKRCKLYYQSDGAWKEKGVGNLHLKVLEDGRAQLLIRAETTLGNVLLNILLSKSIPFNRQGKNSITFMCIPSPAIDVKNPDTVYMMLLRVKTSEEADELLEKINENKK